MGIFGQTSDSKTGVRKRQKGVGVLINTSFNLKGKPLVADALDALKVFCASTAKDLDYVLLEETWLFHRGAVLSRGFCSDDVLDEVVAGHTEIGPDGLPVI